MIALISYPPAFQKLNRYNFSKEEQRKSKKKKNIVQHTLNQCNTVTVRQEQLEAELSESKKARQGMTSFELCI